MDALIAALRNERFRRWAVQALVLAGLLAALGSLVLTAHHNLVTQGIASGFGFLERSTGWDIPFALLDYSIRDPYWKVLLIGFLNTLFVGSLGIGIATVFGTFIGIARVSQNFVLNLFGTVYVELFRNVPLILQGFFWYAVATHLPPPRQAYSIGESFYLSSRGLYAPWPDLGWTGAIVIALVLLLTIAAITWLFRTVLATAGVGARLACIAALFTVAFAALWLAHGVAEPGVPLMEYPVLRGLRFVGGIRVIPELSALTLAIVFFGSAYIAEIVRGGFLGVPRGQLEAAAALGLRPGQIYWTVRIPLALRAIVPPLSNQYVWLMKATTIGIAIGFSDLFMITSTSINQSGQTIELLLIMMVGFLVINYTISTLLNILNRTIALKGYESSHPA